MTETLGQKFITIPWFDGLNIGDGFRQFERVIVSRPAVQPFKIDDSPCSSEDFTLRSMTIVDEESMHRHIDANLKVEAPIYDVPVNVEAGFMNSAEYSDTSMTTFIQMTITDKQRVYKDVPSLTTEATEVLNRDPNEFRKDFGEYFVAGYIGQSSLVATCVFTANSPEELNQFKMKAGAFLEPVSVEGAVSLSQTAQASGINIKLTAHVVGLNMSSGVKTISVNEIGSIFEDFKNKFETRPHRAILHSFATLSLQAVPFGANNEAFDDLEGPFRDIYKLLNSVRHSPNRRARQDMEQKVLTHAEKLQKIVSRDNVARRLEEWRRTYEDYVREFKVWQNRQQVVDDLRWHMYRSLWPKQTSSTSESDWISANDQAEWLWGTCSFLDGNPLCRELTIEHIHYDRTWTVGAQYSGDLTVVGGDKMIIGYKVVSHWQDGTNGEAHTS